MREQPRHKAEGFQQLTGDGPAAIAVFRIWGPRAATFLRRHVRTRQELDSAAWSPGRVLRARLVDDAGETLDDVLVSVHASPPTWNVRVHLHGGRGVAEAFRALLRSAGLIEHPDTPAALWRTRDQIEAEALALLPRMSTMRGVEWLMRQQGLLADLWPRLVDSASEPSARGRRDAMIARRRVFDWFATPLRVALVGPPNVGKSSLANALAGRQVSLVSPTPGTTRDWVEIPGEVEGFPVTWLDTAGLRDGGDELEAEGIRRTRELMRSADATLLVLDAAAFGMPWEESGLAGVQPACVAVNKCDLVTSIEPITSCLPAGWRECAVSVSATRGDGLDALGARLLDSAGYDRATINEAAVFTDRQAQTLRLRT